MWWKACGRVPLSRRAALALSAMLIVVVVPPATSAAAVAKTAQLTTKTTQITVPATHWVDTHLTVKAGDVLRITATGSWTDGSATSGPDGAAKPWPDNFFNLADLGVCQYCAKTKVPEWGALIGYIGSGSPPKDGSYTSTAILPQALRMFYVGANYEAEATESGTLWLNKNADAYSGYISDNSGHVTAKVTIQPPESAQQLANRARVAALSASPATALQQAATFCGMSVLQESKSELINAALEKLIPGNAVSDVFDGATITGDYVILNEDAGNGKIFQAEFDLGRLVFAALGTVPELSLFGSLGDPAIDCGEAGFWLSGQLGGDLGRWLRPKLDPPRYAAASIQGTWTLSRAILTCDTAACLGTPIRVSFTNCTKTQCSMRRIDAPFEWKSAHIIVRHGNTWTGSFTDGALFCGKQINQAPISVEISVVRAVDKNGAEIATALGGTYTVQPAPDPPCAKTGLAVEEIYGNRPIP
jgi:hypothetical protein